MPNEKRSERASSGLPSTCSGDMYATVPSVEPGLVSCSSPASVLASSSPMTVGAFPATESFSSILARPKSRIFAWPRAVTKMLAGLMSRWTMPAVCAASSASAISMRERKQLVHFERALGDGVLERHAVEKFHGDEADAAFAFADFVDGADVVVIERGGGAGFAAEAFERGGIFGDVVGKKFQRDEAAEREVFGFVDDSHAAAAEFFDDAVVGDCLAEHGWTDVSWRGERASIDRDETRRNEATK